MLLVALVEKMQPALIEREASQKERNGLALLDISQQPRVITLPRSRVGQIREVHLKLIIDPLGSALVQLAAVEKERVAAPLGRSEEIPFHKQHRAKARAEDEHKSEDGDDGQRTVCASPAASKHRLGPLRRQIFLDISRLPTGAFHRSRSRGFLRERDPQREGKTTQRL